MRARQVVGTCTGAVDYGTVLAQLSAHSRELGVGTVGTEALLAVYSELPFTVPFAALSL